jgi:hypothetical protein
MVSQRATGGGPSGPVFCGGDLRLRLSRYIESLFEDQNLAERNTHQHCPINDYFIHDLTAELAPDA